MSMAQLPLLLLLLLISTHTHTYTLHTHTHTHTRLDDNKTHGRHYHWLHHLQIKSIQSPGTHNTHTSTPIKNTVGACYSIQRLLLLYVIIIKLFFIMVKR